MNGASDSTERSCIVCQKPVREGTGFARIKHQDLFVTLCCPLCMETFMKRPEVYVSLYKARISAKPPAPSS